jgi:hypothetical protein
LEAIAIAVFYKTPRKEGETKDVESVQTSTAEGVEEEKKVPASP